jgi:hypothetical protein
MGLYSPTLALHLDRRPQTYLFYLLLAIALYCLSDNAMADIPDITTILKNIQKIIRPITALICVFSYIAGVMMIFKAVIKLKKMGGLGTQMAMQQGDLMTILVNFLVGAVLIYIPNASDLLTNSLIGETKSLFSGGTDIDYSGLGAGSDILGYGSNDSNAQWAEVANTLFLYIQFFGFISFIKGWFMISHLGAQGTQQGTGTKGAVHVIGGIIAMNFTQVTEILRNTFLGSG